MKIKDLTNKKLKRISIANFAYFKGSKGTQEHPIIIESSQNLPSSMKFCKSSTFIHIKNCKATKFELKRCKNLTIEKFTLNQLVLHKSSNVKIKNCIINYTLELKKCINLQVLESKIPLLLLVLSFHNNFVGNSFNDIINHYSKANKFENYQYYNYKVTVWIF